MHSIAKPRRVNEVPWSLSLATSRARAATTAGDYAKLPAILRDIPFPIEANIR